MTTRAICTIVSKNYLAHARTLARSFREIDADAKVFVCLVDLVAGAIDPADEPFELIEARALGIPDFDAMAFRYDVMELNTAVKPFVLAHLLFERGIDRVLYLDPDILVLSPLDPVFRELDACSIVLTPHATRPYQDAKQPDEITLLRTGAYNLGFIGVAKTDESRAMLSWWQERCREHCVVQTEDGLFVDQKWIDLVPGFHPGTKILRDPGLNVAYWNLHERTIDSLDPPRCNGSPLYFFHFSGLKTDRLEAISRYQNRFDLGRRPDLRELFELYAEQLVRNGLGECSALPYAYGAFEDGSRIDSLMRRLFRSLSHEDRERFGNPFASGAGTFQHWMRMPAVVTRYHRPRGSHRHWLKLKSLAVRALARFLRKGAYVDNLMYCLHQTDVRVMTRFPDPFGRDRSRFLRWVRRRRAQLYDGDAQSALLTAWATARPAPPFQPWSEAGAAGVRRAIDLPPWLAARRRAAGSGVNVLGHFSAQTGVGEAARGISRAIEAAGIPVVRNNLDESADLRESDATYTDFPADNPHAINLVHVNADELHSVRKDVGRSYFRGRFNVGYWLWELPEFPDRWTRRFRHLDEIWTSSNFCVEAIAAKAPIPVLRVPVPLDFRPVVPLGRAHFELPEHDFVFLFAFDFASYFERKNPLAVIRAFQLAFQERDGALLVIKSSNGERFPEQLQRLKDAAGKHRVRILDGNLDRNEMRNLVRLCDCYVSLHRSEGFGLSMAEAMAFARPVIATAYSANLDYMNPDNSLLVRHRLVEVEQDVGPYLRGQLWADPDVEQAASFMRRVYEDSDLAASMGRRARQDVERELGDERVGERIRRRLAALR